MKSITAIVLAAGMSTRMMDFKQLLPFKGKKILTYIIEEIQKSDIDEIIVVTGHNQSLIQKELSNYGVKTVYNSNYQEGMLSSVICGVGQVSPNTEHFLIFLGDQPCISSNLINKLIQTKQQSEKGIIIPSFNNKRGHPVVFDRSYIKQINSLDSNQGLKQLINDNEQDIAYYIHNDDSILKDIDTPEDYKSIKNVPTQIALMDPQDPNNNGIA